MFVVQIVLWIWGLNRFRLSHVAGMLAWLRKQKSIQKKMWVPPGRDGYGVEQTHCRVNRQQGWGYEMTAIRLCLSWTFSLLLQTGWALLNCQVDNFISKGFWHFYIQKLCFPVVIFFFSMGAFSSEAVITLSKLNGSLFAESKPRNEVLQGKKWDRIIDLDITVHSVNFFWPVLSYGLGWNCFH